ncbi:MAG: hypothetical protein H6Q90_1805 [Deltaproteobacteria bacterium]|nr:hypothetical protein [Deltaproteobacteria bacterium]
MNLKGFFVTTLSQALDLAIATPEDVLRHVTPDLLSQHLPRPLWARLLTACMGAPRVDAQLIVDTIGVPNLCEHIPVSVIWTCITEIAQRALGGESAVPTRPVFTRPSGAVPLSMTPPPPAEQRVAASSAPVAVGPTIPAPAQSLSDVVAALEADERTAAPLRSRSPTQQRFRGSSTGIGRLSAAANRRPQATASPAAEPAPARRSPGDADPYDETATGVGKDDWKSALAVEDEQLVDWSAADETLTSNETRDDGVGRKR